MAKIVYSELSDEKLLIETQNLMNEIRAFMNHEIISTRKINELSTKVYEISGELNVRGGRSRNEELALTMLSKRIDLAEVLMKLKNNCKEAKSQPQPQ